MGYVLVLATEENLKMGDCYSPFEDYEIKAAIPVCDGVEEVVDPEQIRAALTELNTVYAAPIIEITAREYHGEKTFGVLDTRKLLEVLHLRKSERIRKVSQELSKPDPDLWAVAHEAYNRSEHYFLDSGEALLMNEVDALEFDFEEHVYVTQVYEFN